MNLLHNSHVKILYPKLRNDVATTFRLRDFKQIIDHLKAAFKRRLKPRIKFGAGSALHQTVRGSAATRFVNDTCIIRFYIISILMILTPLLLSTDAIANDDIPEYFVPPPPFSEDIFPCSQCHDEIEADPTQRELSYHSEIAKGFSHAKEQRWCLDCHNPDDRDKLRLASGRLISFKKSYYLCGQCHGTIFRDWKAGLHGLRTGMWKGKKEYRLCVHCHNPHQPRFKPLKPLPPPMRPEDIKYRKISLDKIPTNPLNTILRSEDAKGN